MPDPTPVRKCVCADMTFAQMQATGIRTIPEMQRKLGVCMGCRTCEPYIQKMIETGNVAFEVIGLAVDP